MTDPIVEVILTRDQKHEFKLTPIYVPISATDVATVWQHLHAAIYFAAGKYLGVNKLEGKIVGQRYRRLDRNEFETVEKAIKDRDRNSQIIIDLQHFTFPKQPD